LTRQAFPRQSDIQAPSNENWLANEACLAHALRLEDVYKNAPTPIDPPDHFVELLADVGNYMWEKGLYERGILTLQLAKRIHKQPNRYHDLIEHSKVCTLLCGIFLELGISGRKEGLAEALECWGLRQKYLSQITSAAEEMTQENWLLVANSWNDIACCMIEYGCYNKAEAWMTKSLEVKHKRGIPEDGAAFFSFAENYKNLAIIRTSQNRHCQAVELSKKAALLVEKHSSIEKAVVLSFRFHLAYALYQEGSLEEALQVHEQVRQMRAQVFGQHNVHTLNSYYACAVVHQALGQAAKAECVQSICPGPAGRHDDNQANRLYHCRELLEYCLAVETNNTWTQGYVARIKFRLASLWTGGGHRPSDAEALVREAQGIREHHAKYFRPFRITAGPEGEEAVVYDHMIPIEGGRSTVGQLHVSASNIPEASAVVMS
jgi:tetratricopeptide (TPR) repeat protein